MEVFDTYVGNVRDEKSLAARLDGERTVTVDDDQRRRSRFRAVTEDGTEVGVVLARELRAGDVLSTGEDDGPLLEVALEPVEALVVDFADADAALVTAVALGHAAGNRHWDMAVRDDEVLFPATESDARMDETIQPHLPEGATVRREKVSPATFDGGDSGLTPDDAHGHSHDDSHATTAHEGGLVPDQDAGPTEGGDDA